MGVSIYYTARRERPLSAGEQAEAAGIAAEETRELFARLSRHMREWKEQGTVPPHIDDAQEICEGLVLYDFGATDEPGVILRGSSKLSHGECGEEPMLMQVEYYAAVALGRLRLAVPGAEWDVHVDDMPLQWQEEQGQYSFT
ncbi:hypothetical protein ACN3XK_74485 [Actinomadura welshii]